MRGLLTVAFLPNYNVSAAEVIVPPPIARIRSPPPHGASAPQHKLALNGALTIGTLDGATVEMAGHIGRENLFLFGLSAEEVAERRAGGWRGAQAVADSDMLGEVLEAVGGGVFSPDDRDRYKDLVASLRAEDWFMVAADFDSYLAAQKRASALYRDPRLAPHRGAEHRRMGWFSSDRSIAEYAAEIWNVPVAP